MKRFHTIDMTEQALQVAIMLHFPIVITEVRANKDSDSVMRPITFTERSYYSLKSHLGVHRRPDRTGASTYAGFPAYEHHLRRAIALCAAGYPDSITCLSS